MEMLLANPLPINFQQVQISQPKINFSTRMPPVMLTLILLQAAAVTTPDTAQFPLPGLAFAPVNTSKLVALQLFLEQLVGVKAFEHQTAIILTHTDYSLTVRPII